MLLCRHAEHSESDGTATAAEVSSSGRTVLSVGAGRPTWLARLLWEEGNGFRLFRKVCCFDAAEPRLMSCRCQLAVVCRAQVILCVGCARPGAIKSCAESLCQRQFWMKAALRRPGKASAASAAGGTGSAASAHDRHVYILTSSATLAGVQTTLCTAALLSCTTAAWCILAGLDHREQHAGRRSQWFALLLAPFGAVLRWLLSGYNSRLPRPLHWFPAGTFAANMLACGIDYVLMVSSELPLGPSYPAVCSTCQCMGCSLCGLVVACLRC